MKVLCRWHEDSSPSMQVYANGGYCFVCQKYAKPEELSGIDFAEVPQEEAPEELDDSFAYIDSLPKLDIRGLKLPADAWGYYVVWPDRSYYKKRLHEGKARYLGARGHKKGLFWARQDGHRALVIVEGEINALSIAAACPGIDVLSPGGVGDFSEKKVKQQLYNYTSYCIILVVADADKPGAEAIINTLSVLWANKLQAVGLPMQSDANEILVNFGPERLQQEIQQGIEKALAKGPK